MKKNKIIGFTLVELIIVITILAILSTVAFVSFQGYTKKSQDSVRLESLSSISKGLEVFEAANSKFPLPDNKIDIKSGTEIISYQGVAGDSVLNIIKSSKAQDPLDKTYFTYSVDKTQKKYSLLTYLQNQLSYNSIEVLANYSNRFPYVTGNKVGVLLDNSNNPIQETLTGILDLSTSTNNYKVYFSNDTTSGIFTLSGSSLANKIVAVISNTSCSGTTYTGTYANYNILPLTNNTTYTFSYNSGSVANGNFSSSVQATCKDGNLSYANEQKTLNCNTGYYSSGNITCESQWYSSGGVYTFKNTSGNITYPTTCNDLLNTNSFKVGSLNYTGTGFLSGEYYINSTGTGSFKVYCDMISEGGGWTIYPNGNTYITSLYKEINETMLYYGTKYALITPNSLNTKQTFTLSGGYIIMPVYSTNKLGYRINGIDFIRTSCDTNYNNYFHIMSSSSTSNNWATYSTNWNNTLTNYKNGSITLSGNYVQTSYLDVGLGGCGRGMNGVWPSNFSIGFRN